MLLAMIKLIRLPHWVKNGFVFIPAFFGQALMEGDVAMKLGFLFVAMGMCASATYVINDIADREADAQHPEKKNRPIAAGKIKVPVAVVMAFILAGGGLAIAFWLGKTELALLGGYFGMNLLYSFWLKRVAILDIVIIALGFEIRIFAGGIVAGVALSEWLIVMTFLLAMFLGLAKRRDDVLLKEKTGVVARKSLSGYSMRFIELSTVIMLSVLVVTYIIYTVSPEITERIGSKNVYITAVFVLLALLRYLQVMLQTDRPAAPTSLIFKDWFILSMLIGWTITFCLLLYEF